MTNLAMSLHHHPPCERNKYTLKPSRSSMTPLVFKSIWAHLLFSNVGSYRDFTGNCDEPPDLFRTDSEGAFKSKNKIEWCKFEGGFVSLPPGYIHPHCFQRLRKVHLVTSRQAIWGVCLARWRISAATLLFTYGALGVADLEALGPSASHGVNLRGCASSLRSRRAGTLRNHGC